MANRHTAFALLAASALLAAPLYPQPPQMDPAALPARDSHQGVLVAVRADTTALASKSKFGQHDLYDAGLLGLEVYFRNDNDQPIRINLRTVRLLIGAPGERQQRLEPLSDAEVTDAVLKKRDPSLVRRTPIPSVGLNAGHDKNWQQFDSVVRSVAMSADILPPRTTVHGYFYFDIDHQFAWLSNARLDVPDLSYMMSKQGLLFFDVDLAPVAQP